MLGMSLEEYKAKLNEALAAWKSTSATTESGLANPKEAQARKTYQTMRKQYKALQQRESEKQQAQAAQQEYDELRVADLNALKAKMDAAKESADGSAKERVVAGSIVKQKDSGAQAAYEEAARKYNLAQQIQYDERGALALGKLSEEEAAAVDTLAKSTNKGRKTDIVGAGVIDEMRRKATKVLTDAGYSAEEIDELANWRARQQNAQKYDAAVEKREALADKGFWGAAAATALSVPETLLSGIGVIDVAVQNYENRGTDRPADYKRTAMLPYAKATAGRSTISNKLEQNTDAEIFGQNVAASVSTPSHWAATRQRFLRRRTCWPRRAPPIRMCILTQMVRRESLLPTSLLIPPPMWSTATAISWATSSWVLLRKRSRRRHCKPKSTRHCPPIWADPRFLESVYDEEKNIVSQTFCAPLHRLWQASTYTIEMAFEGETGASEGCSSLETPAPSNRYWTNTYFFSGGFAVKYSL